MIKGINLKIADVHKKIKIQKKDVLLASKTLHPLQSSLTVDGLICRFEEAKCQGRIIMYETSWNKHILANRNAVDDNSLIFPFSFQHELDLRWFLISATKCSEGPFESNLLK